MTPRHFPAGASLGGKAPRGPRVSPPRRCATRRGPRSQVRGRRFARLILDAATRLRACRAGTILPVRLRARAKSRRDRRARAVVGGWRGYIALMGRCAWLSAGTPRASDMWECTATQASPPSAFGTSASVVRPGRGKGVPSGW